MSRSTKRNPHKWQYKDFEAAKKFFHPLAVSWKSGKVNDKSLLFL